jgi:hypothetical protein
MLGGEGILEGRDIPELGAQVARVYRLMKDGRWYTRFEIELAAGGMDFPAPEGMRRMRELRRDFIIERKKDSGTRVFQYRLTFRKLNKD